MVQMFLAFILLTFAIGVIFQWVANTSIERKIKFMKAFIFVLGCAIIAAVILTCIVILF